MLTVQKFGGSSLDGTDRLRRAADLCAEKRRVGNDLVVVVSAAGDTTDDLVNIAREISPRPNLRELDALLATGERRSAALMAIMLSGRGINARSFSGGEAGIYTDESYGAAQITRIDTAPLAESLSRGEVAVVCGFQGMMPDGSTATLGRGGSDTSAVALAAALNARECEIYTDVDGVYTADPNIVRAARPIKTLDYGDMLALAESGAQILHPRAAAEAMKSGVKVRILSSFTPGEGTLLCALSEKERPALAGLALKREEGALSLVGRSAGEDVQDRLTALLSEAGIIVRRAECEMGRVCITLPEKSLIRAAQLAHREFFE